jgi:hypothetical protein
VDRLADAFMREIDEHFGTAPEPTRPTCPESERPRSERPGLNLSALRDDEDPAPAPEGGSSAGPEWLPDALAAIAEAGAAGMKPSAVADHVRRSRQAVRDALKAAAERGELVYRDNGPHSVYVHPDHT